MSSSGGGRHRADRDGTRQDQSLDHLRKLLLKVKPTGVNGFEGLVANILAAMTGFVFRLAKSGSQFGRDASTIPGLFAVAMEAKLYKRNPRLEDLAGKAVVGGQALSGKIDLWVLGATSEVGDNTVKQLSEILDSYGVSLLMLDWAPSPLPPLAVLLASARDAALAWFAKHQAQVDRNKLSTALDTIADATGYPDHAKMLRQQLTASEIGLDALRRRTADWLHDRFRNRAASQRTFGQFITIADPSAPPLSRSAEAKSLADAIVIDPQDPTVLAVLGDEGVGKTWLIAQWWATLSEQPILILVAGRRADVLNPTAPLESLARLLAQQDGRSDDAAVAAWCRRLARWKAQYAEGRLRFVIVLDGLNEHAGMPWADILNALAPEVYALGGLVMATSREAFWSRDVMPRIHNTLNVRAVPLAGYTDEDLTVMLARVGAAPADLPPRVREFVRNPRVCAVALDHLHRLSLQPNELTVERLLLEYWRWRLEERGDLVSHNIQDLEKLLRSHAGDWLAQPHSSFDRDDWTKHSGAMRRADGRDFHNDLTEIVEGRFMRPASDNSGAYEFREETLPFALALLVNHELKSGLKVPGNDADELLGGILDPVRGFDLIAEVVAAAAGMACIEDTFPVAGRLALILAWLGLQNVSNEPFTTMSAYVPTRPGAFFDVAELSDGRIGNEDRHNSLMSLITLKRDHPKVFLELQSRLPKWLGRWSRQAQIAAQGDKQAKIQGAREVRIDDSLRALSPDERKLFDQICNEAPERSAMHLDWAAAILTAARAQEHLASGLVGWAFAQAIAGDNHDAERELAWVIRLNPIDHAETEAAVRRLIEPITSGASEPARRAAATALNLLGTRSAAALADKLTIRGSSKRWRLVDNFCDTNPYDPNAPPGSNLDKARAAAVQMPASQVWNTMYYNPEDRDLEVVTPALARFDPPVVAKILREIIRSIENRTQLQFRQLACFLPELSPLFDEATIQAVKTAYHRLISQPNIVRDIEFGFIAYHLIISIIPHLDEEAQLDILLSLPSAVPDYRYPRHAFKPLSTEVLERRLESALALPNMDNLRRTLFFISASSTVMSDRMRQIIADLVNSPEEIIAIAASAVVYTAKDHNLNATILEQAQRSGCHADNSAGAFGQARAVAEAVIEQKREDLLNLIAPRFLGQVVGALGKWKLVADYVECVLNRLLQPVVTPALRSVRLIESVSEDERETSTRIEDCSESSHRSDPLSLFNDFSNSETVAKGFFERQEEMLADAEAFERALTNAGAADLAMPPPLDGIANIVIHDPRRVAHWLDRILNTTETLALGQIHNLGVVMAGAYASSDPDKAAAVLRHLRKHPPLVYIEIGKDRVSLYNRALFSTSDVVALDPLREGVFGDAFDDAQLEEAISAAEACGAVAWIDRYMDGLLASAHPSDQARGLTIAGLRQVNIKSDRVLAEPWGSGFLGEVASAAVKNYQCNRWAQHWFNCARTSSDPIDFWRFGKLAEGVVDQRFVGWFESKKYCYLLTTFGDEVYERFMKAAQKCTKKRKDTLFGLKAPERDLLVM